MKIKINLSRLLLAATMLLGTHLFAGTLVEDGEMRATIVISDAALQAEPYKAARGQKGTAPAKIKTAALDLQKYLEKLSGAKLPIVSDAADVSGAVVYVGPSRQTESIKGLKIPSGLTPARQEDGYVIWSDDDRLVLAGNDEGPYCGTYYAVTEFLRRQGVRWILPGEFGEIVPKQSTVKFARLNVTERPGFRYRTWWCNLPADLGEIESLWKLRQKMQVADTDLIGIPGDGYLRNYMPDLTLTNSRPELFGKRFDGSLDPHMPNLSNPEAAQLVADKVIAAIRESEKKGERVHSLGFAPDDGLPMDHTPQTMTELNQRFPDWVGREGVPTELSISEEWFTFMNRVADRVCAEFPDFIITSNGYANRANPPEGFKLHPNMGIMGAFIWADTTKPVNSPRSWHGQIMGGQIQRWCELSKHVFLYEYNATMLVTALSPVPQTRKVSENYRLFKKWGLAGFFNETTFPYFQDGIATRYVRANLMWNPDADLPDLLDDFYGAWYGPAAKPAAAFWTAIEDALLNSPLLGHEDRILPFVYSDDLINALENHCRQAEKLGAAEPFKTRVRIDRLTLDHLKSYMAYKAAEFDARWAEAVAELKRMLELRLELNKISPFLAMPPSIEGVERYFASDHYWGTIHRRDYFQKVNDFTTGQAGDLVALAPKNAKFTLDENAVGRDLKWYAPGHDRRKWRSLDSTEPFYAQGYLSDDGAPYVGKMWYVFEVDVPAKFQGKPIRLYTPFLTCQAWTWVNGEYAGARPYLEAYISPAPMDLDVTKLVKPGRNTIAVWVGTGTAKTQAADGFLGRLLLYSPKDPAKTMSSN